MVETQIPQNIQSAFTDWQQYIGDDPKTVEQFSRILQLVATVHDPAEMSRHVQMVISPRDKAKAIAERRRHITLLQNGIVFLKQRFMERHDVSKEKIHAHPDYRRIADPIQYARMVFQQQGGIR